MNDQLTKVNAELRKEQIEAARQSVPMLGFIAGFPGGLTVPSAIREIQDGRDAAFQKALAKSHASPKAFCMTTPETVPAEMHKSEAPDPVSLIKLAHGNAMAIEDLARGYLGREQRAIAKAAAVEREKIDASKIAKVSPELRKVLADFDAMVKRYMNRAGLSS